MANLVEIISATLMNTLACPTHSQCNSSRGIPLALQPLQERTCTTNLKMAPNQFIKFEYGTNLNIDTVQAKDGTHLIIALNIWAHNCLEIGDCWSIIHLYVNKKKLVCVFMMLVILNIIDPGKFSLRTVFNPKRRSENIKWETQCKKRQENSSIGSWWAEQHSSYQYGKTVASSHAFKSKMP